MVMALLVFRSPFAVIDDQDINGSLLSVERESELVLYRSKDIWRRIGQLLNTVSGSL